MDGLDLDVLFAQVDWQMQAACAGAYSPDRTFFRTVVTPEAKRLCGKCPVKQECLDFSVRLKIEHGIWGGLAPPQRRPLFDPHRRRDGAYGIKAEPSDEPSPPSLSAARLDRMLRLIRISYEPRQLSSV